MNLDFIKQKIMLSPLASYVKQVEANGQLLRLSKQGSKIANNSTVYSISPYKTGTTFLSTCFDKKVARHEPLQYLSLKGLNKDFDSLFLRRLNTLNLKLECSGFFSAYVDELANHRIAKNLIYLCIVRKPSSWVSSVINYWGRSKYVMKRYDFINELFWVPKTGVDFKRFFSLDAAEQELEVNKLLDFYMDFTKKTVQLDNVIYIPLGQLSSYALALGDLIDERPNFNRAWKRTNNDKTYIYENSEVDSEYNKLIVSLAKSSDVSDTGIQNLRNVHLSR